MKISEIINEALKEDISKGDITSNAVIPKSTAVKAEIIAKQKGIIAGLDVAKTVFREVDNKIVFIKKVNDGEFVKKGKIIAELRGNTRAILSSERVALNFLQRLSGIATLTYEFVKLAGNVKILDTRKTTPLLRELEKYAVRVGGGYNHRFNLNDAVLIKDNHIAIAGSVSKVVMLARKTGKKIEVEAKNIKEVKEALDAHADTLLLDNMNLREIKKAVELARGKAKIEVSGGVNLKNIRKIANVNVDFISIGALTHSPKAMDISLEVRELLMENEVN